MYYGAIKKTDIANGIGVRVSLFVSGCRNHCDECFQPETWDFSYGQPFTDDTLAEIMQAVAPSYITGFTVLGGEPFEEENQETVWKVLSSIHEKYPDKTLWAYTGYTLDEDLFPGQRKYGEYTGRILRLLDVLVDGRFKKDQKDLSLKFRGSANQRLIDMKQTLESGDVVLLSLENE